MKNMKKLASLLLALVMVFSLATTAFAATDDDTPTTGTITITNATENVKYSIYKVFDLTYSGDAVSYTYTKTSESDDLYTALTGSDSPFSLTQIGTTNVYNVAANGDKTSADVGTWLKTNVALLGDGTSKIATGTTVEFTDVDYGYYYVTSTLGSAVTVDSAMPNASIEDKNEKPTIDKSVWDGDSWEAENDVNIGDTVEYKADITVKAGAKNYVLHDTMSDGLTFAKVDSVKIGETAVAAANYTVTSTGLTDGCTFEVSFNNDYLATLDASTVITVEYSATLNEEAVIDGAGNPNTAKLSYGDTVNVDDDNNPDTPDVPKTPETVPDTTTTYTYAIALKKVDKDGKNLAGATFQFPFYVQKDADDDGAYIYAGTTEDTGLINTITTPDSGEIVVKGVDAATYSITETEAPAGYNKLTAPVSVTAVKTGKTTTNTTTYLDEDGNITDVTTDTTAVEYENNALSAAVIVVVNLAGSTLPSTGGMGTTLFYVFGGILVAAAVVLLVTKKRMSTAE